MLNLDAALREILGVSKAEVDRRDTEWKNTRAEQKNRKQSP
jgi:hypothetical protein